MSNAIRAAVLILSVVTVVWLRRAVVAAVQRRAVNQSHPARPKASAPRARGPVD